MVQTVDNARIISAATRPHGVGVSAEAVEHLAGREDVEVAEFEAGQVLVAADKGIDTGGSSERNEIVIVGVAAHRRDDAWIRNQFCTVLDGGHVRLDLCHRDPRPESVPRQHIIQLVEERWADYQNQVAGVDRRDDRARSTTWGQQRRHEHVGVRDDPHWPREGLGVLGAVGQGTLRPDRLGLRTRERHRLLSRQITALPDV